MFESRSGEMEFLDGPDFDPDAAAASYRVMETVNRRFGGISVVRRFIEGEAVGRDRSSPLRILDIGSGSCDIPIAVSRWAKSRGIPLHFTCLEKSNHAVRIAAARLSEAGCSDARLVSGDVGDHKPNEPYHCAVASMCFHHFRDDMILAILGKLRGCVLNSVLINDLRRSPLAYLGATALSLGFPDKVRHDCTLSVRRGFRVSELRGLLSRLEGACATVTPAWLFRICAVVRFDQRGQL